MADVRELIERLERATGPDRKLDVELRMVADKRVMLTRDAIDQIGVRGSGWTPGEEWPRYTASIDAVLTLVPPTHDLAGVYWALVVSSKGNFKGRGKTPAIDLCIAALHARLSQEPT